MEAEFVRQVRFHLNESRRKIDVVWSGLSEEQIWLRPNEHTLAPANQLIHLAGNLRQWVGTALAGMPPVRQRDDEFAARGGLDKAAVLDLFDASYQLTLATLGLPAHLERPVTVQGHPTSALGVWIHVTEHLSYHTGQLIFFAKQLRGAGYDFYADWDLG